MLGDELDELVVLDVHALAVDRPLLIGHVTERVAEVLRGATGQVLLSDAALGLDTGGQDVAGQPGHVPVPLERPEYHPDAADEGAVVGDDRVGRCHRVHAAGGSHGLHVGDHLVPGSLLVPDDRIGDRSRPIDAAAGGVHQQQHAGVVIGPQRVQLLGDLVSVGAGGEHAALPGALDGPGNVQRQHGVGRIRRPPHVLGGRQHVGSRTADGAGDQSGSEQADQQQRHRDKSDAQRQSDAGSEASCERLLLGSRPDDRLRSGRWHPLNRRGGGRGCGCGRCLCRGFGAAGWDGLPGLFFAHEVQYRRHATMGP